MPDDALNDPPTLRMPGRPTTRVFLNDDNQIVIRQDASGVDLEDAFVIFDERDIPELVRWLRACSVESRRQKFLAARRRGDA